MSSSDIIDNRHKTLVETIKAVLPGTERARFAVGYFFLSGLEALGEGSTASGVAAVDRQHLNRETIEQFSEGYKRLELVSSGRGFNGSCSLPTDA